MTMIEFTGLCWSQFWQLTLLIAVVALAAVTVLKRRPHLLHLLWIVVIVKSLTLPLWSSPTSVFSWLQPGTAAANVDSGILSPAPSPSSGTVLQPSLQLAAARSHALALAAPSQKFRDMTGTFLMVWVAGVLVLLGLASRRWMQVYREIKQGCRPADVDLAEQTQRLASRLGVTPRTRLLISRANLGPMIFGSYRPIVILPEALTSLKTPAELQPIVAHELIHAKRGDTIFGALQFLSQVFWWFHPLVWWACRQANRVSERCCDEEVIANLGCKPSQYANCLLDTLELHATLNPAPALPGIRSVDVTSSRLKNIMSNATRFRRHAPRHHWLYAVALALIVFPGGELIVKGNEDKSVPPARTAAAELRDAGERAVVAHDWTEASNAYRTLTQRDETDARAWFMLGYCLHASGRLEEAIDAHTRAATFANTKPTALYNLACAYSLKDRKELAIGTLRRAIDAGFVSPTPIGNDSDFATLKDDPEFQKLAAAAKPHAEREVYRQFDFWIGRWNVLGRDGQKVGTNTVTKDQKGFLLTEKWTDVRGGTGTSINYYDPSEGHWKQTWVDAGGNVVHYRGRFDDGKMLLRGQLSTPNGVIVASRVSYSRNEDGSVRQLIEHSHDEGKTWSVYFDGRYVAIEPQPAAPAPDSVSIRAAPATNST